LRQKKKGKVGGVFNSGQKSIRGLWKRKIREQQMGKKKKSKTKMGKKALEDPDGLSPVCEKKGREGRLLRPRTFG